MSVSINFIGAHETVTGSCTHVKIEGKSFLVDCGLFQGPKEVRKKNWDDFPITAKDIKAVFLTHAHLDHSGFLPRLVKSGFKGKIVCSEATAQLCKLLLMDAAYLEEEFARFANESGYSNHKPAKPLFDRSDVEKTIPLFTPIKRHEWFELFNGHGVRLHRAGHIPGASYIEFSFTGFEKPRRILFSGDVGNDRLFTMRAPEPFPQCEDLILESTYGNRLQPRCDTLKQFEAVINRTSARNGVLVIPAFAVGRAQEVIYLIRLLEKEKRIPKLPVILDSPMAIEATSLFLAHPEDHKLDVSQFAIDDSFTPEFYEVSSSANDSMLATMREGPMIVISAAGMLSGGRILHHLKHRLPHEENTVLFTGYQAEGSKGRYLQENAGSAKTLRIHHQEIEINAEIETLDCLSSHADYQDIVKHIAQMNPKPKSIWLNHGSPNSQKDLALRIYEEFQIECRTSSDPDSKAFKIE